MIEDINGIATWRLDETGPMLGSGASASELIGELYGQGADVIAIPIGRIDPEFFRLASGLAGEFIQKLQNYGYRIAIVGDIARRTEASGPLHDFVHETNRRGHHLFVASDAELDALLR
jgi:Domain of unknown function (DUF4180)